MKRIFLLLTLFLTFSIYSQSGYISKPLRLGVSPVANNADFILANGTHSGKSNVTSKTQITVQQLTNAVNGAIPTLQQVTGQGNTTTNEIIGAYIGTNIGGSGFQVARELGTTRTANARGFWDRTTLTGNTTGLSYAGFDAHANFSNSTMGHITMFQARNDISNVTFTEEIEYFAAQSLTFNNVTSPSVQQFYGKHPINSSGSNITDWYVYRVEDALFPGANKWAFHSPRADMNALFGGYLQAGSLRIPSGSNYVNLIAPSGLSSNPDVTMPSGSGTLALTSDIPSTSDFASLSSSNTFTGTNTFSSSVGLLNSNLSFGDGDGTISLTASNIPTGNIAVNFRPISGDAALTSDLANYFPLTGGATITGATTINNVTGRALIVDGSNLAVNDASIYIGNDTGDNVGFGWDILYKGSGSGNENSLDFVSQNGGSASVTAMSMKQNGVVKLANVLNLTPRSSAPGSPSKGDIYFDDTLNLPRYYNGTTWVNM